MPGFIRPQLATLKPRAPKGDQWLHEIKYDGYRVQVHLNRGRKKVFTRNGRGRLGMICVVPRMGEADRYCVSYFVRHHFRTFAICWWLIN